MNEKSALSYANKLENLLREHLNCHYTDFGVKANDNLISGDWKSPINFALGYKYALSNCDPSIKDSIDSFLGDELHGENIEDIIENYDHYDFDSVDDAYDYIDKTIESLKKILSK